LNSVKELSRAASQKNGRKSLPCKSGSFLMYRQIVPDVPKTAFLMYRQDVPDVPKLVPDVPKVRESLCATVVSR